MQELCLSDQNFLFLTLQEYGKCSFVIWLSYYKLCHFILSEFSVFSGIVVNLSWIQTMFYLVREIVVIRHFLIATETTKLFLEIFVNFVVSWNGQHFIIHFWKTTGFQYVFF